MHKPRRLAAPETNRPTSPNVWAERLTTNEIGTAVNDRRKTIVDVDNDIVSYSMTSKEITRTKFRSFARPSARKIREIYVYPFPSRQI